MNSRHKFAVIFWRCNFSLNWLTTCRKFINNRNIKFSKKCQCHGSGDRSSRHLDNMRISMLREKSPLSDSKLMLFIDHNQPQIRKTYIRLQNSMSSYNNINLSDFCFFFQIIFVSLGTRTREQIDSNT